MFVREAIGSQHIYSCSAKTRLHGCYEGLFIEMVIIRKIHSIELPAVMGGRQHKAMLLQQR